MSDRHAIRATIFKTRVNFSFFFVFSFSSHVRFASPYFFWILSYLSFRRQQRVLFSQKNKHGGIHSETVLSDSANFAPLFNVLQFSPGEVTSRASRFRFVTYIIIIIIAINKYFPDEHPPRRRPGPIAHASGPLLSLALRGVFWSIICTCEI